MINVIGKPGTTYLQPTDSAGPSDDEVGIESTLAQREIFSASLSDPQASLGYNHSISIFFTGALDLDSIYSALINLVDRHEALRGHFSGDGLRFLVRDQIDLDLPLIDCSTLPETETSAAYDDFLESELAHVFDLTDGPLFRPSLVKLASTRWVLLLNCHHAVVDGWSLKVILDDLPKLYNALVRGEDDANLEDPSSFVEHLEYARRRERESAGKVRAFWKEVYAEGVPILDLPLDHPRPLARTYASERNDYRLDRHIYRRLVDFGAGRGVSQFATLLSAFALFLHRLSGQDDLVIGVPAAGQIAAGKAKLLGHDARVMPIRCVLHEEDDFSAYARRMMNTFLAAYENQWISIPELLNELKPPIDPARAPFVSVMFNFDPGMKDGAFTFDGLEARHIFNPRKAETFEISVNAVVEGPDLVLEWVYNMDLFDAAEMRRHLDQCQRLMRSIVDEPALAVKRLSVVPSDQIDALDRNLNSTEMDYERELCVDALVARMVDEYPGKIAIEFGSAASTYEQLWSRSGQIAASILEMNLGPNPLIGVMIDRGEMMVAVLVGVWRAGGAYVPLDPTYPLDRLQYMVDHSQIPVVLIQGSAANNPAVTGATLVDVGTIPDNPGFTPAPLEGRSPDDRAYVIYTSGSSGGPKGVQIPHRALNNFLQSMRTKEPGLGPDDRMLAITTISFDISALEIWLPLVTGATIVIVDRATAIDGQALASVITEHRVNYIQATPATWRLLIYSGWTGDNRITALCGGEALSRDLADELLARVGMLWNMYGPTEATVWSTLDRVGAGLVTIGRPIGNTQAYILDAARQWVPRGCVGELWLGGAGVAIGYLGRDDLTLERFAPNSFTGRGRIYRTGDLARQTPDGRIEYLGRNDFQVKVRGYRIELGEVEHALAKHPSIQQCTVVVRERSPGDAHLIAYYTTHAGRQASAAELRGALRKQLPDYMIPGIFISLVSLPLTQNGKVDLKSLPLPFEQAQVALVESRKPHRELEHAEALLRDHADIEQAVLAIPNTRSQAVRPIAFIVPRAGEEPGIIQVRKQLRSKIAEPMIPDTVVLIEQIPRMPDGRVDRGALLASAGFDASGDTASDVADEPRTEAERLLAGIWGEFLGIDPVGIYDNFFRLGGSSLQSIQIIERVQKLTGYRLNPRHVVLSTLEQLACELPSTTLLSRRE